jgi:DnaJ-class molecular chaperone
MSLANELEDMVKASQVVRVQRHDGKWGYAPAPGFKTCPHCSGSGIMLDEELQLEGLCPECGGYGEV